MAVKRSQSALRVLAVLEQIASRQPIGASALAELLREDKSAIQRALMTLADAGWIRIAPAPPMRWELSAHFFALSQLPHSVNDLRRRARGLLESLRTETGETSFLAIPDIRGFVAIDVAESPHMLRMAVRVGEAIPLLESATGRAVLPHLSREHLTAMLGRAPDAAEIALLEAERSRGYGLSVGEVLPGSTNIAAPIFDHEGQPIAALVISGPAERITHERHEPIGKLLALMTKDL